MTDFDAMSNSELAREAAKLMGWPEIGRDAPFSEYKGVHNGVICDGNPLIFQPRPSGALIPVDYSPAVDLNHLAVLSEGFLSSWPDLLLHVVIRPRSGFSAYAYRSDGPTWRVDHASEARARTCAVLKAWAALNGQ